MYVLIDLSNESFEFYKNTIFDFVNELKKITILDISKLVKKKAKRKPMSQSFGRGEYK